MKQQIFSSVRCVDQNEIKNRLEDRCHISRVAYFKTNGDNCKIYINIGLDTINAEKYYILDYNLNCDFSDDSVYKVKLSDKPLNPYDLMENYINIKYKPVSIYDYKNSAKQLSEVIINPFPIGVDKKDYNSYDDYFLEMELLTNLYYKGYFNLNGKNIKVQGFNDFLMQNDSILNSMIFILPNQDKYPSSYCIGDTVLLDDSKLHILKYENSILTLTNLGLFVDSCYVGSYVPELYSQKLDKDTTVLINQYFKDKFVLLDFWGSWCGPCVASIPKLRDLYAKIKDRIDVTMVGIALEREQDLQKLNKIIKGHGIEWLNLWNNWNSRKSLALPQGKLKIQDYPTYIILDKSGKIIFNTNDPLCRREDAVDFFINLIK